MLLIMNCDKNKTESFPLELEDLLLREPSITNPEEGDINIRVETQLEQLGSRNWGYISR